MISIRSPTGSTCLGTLDCVLVLLDLASCASSGSVNTLTAAELDRGLPGLPFGSCKYSGPAAAAADEIVTCLRCAVDELDDAADDLVAILSSIAMIAGCTIL